jgi:hypothetical protein
VGWRFDVQNNETVVEQGDLEEREGESETVADIVESQLAVAFVGSHAAAAAAAAVVDAAIEMEMKSAMTLVKGRRSTAEEDVTKEEKHKKLKKCPVMCVRD